MEQDNSREHLTFEQAEGYQAAIAPALEGDFSGTSCIIGADHTL